MNIAFTAIIVASILTALKYNLCGMNPTWDFTSEDVGTFKKNYTWRLTIPKGTFELTIPKNTFGLTIPEDALGSTIPLGFLIHEVTWGFTILWGITHDWGAFQVYHTWGNSRFYHSIYTWVDCGVDHTGADFRV